MKKAPTILGNKTKFAGMTANRKYHKARKAARIRKAELAFKDGKGFVRKMEYDLSLTPEESTRMSAILVELTKPGTTLPPTQE